MAWYSSWTRAQRLAITVPSGTTAALSYFPVVLTAASLPTELTNNTYGRSNGGDLAFTAEPRGGQFRIVDRRQIPCEVVSAVFGGTPSAEIHVQVPSVAATGTLTYIWVLYGNSGQTAQPVASSTYGSQKVWNENGTQNYAGVYHLNEAGTNPTTNDSTSNAKNSTAQTWTPTASGQIGRGASFSGSQLITLPSSTFSATNDYTLSGWGNDASGSGYRVIFAASTTYPFLGTSGGKGYVQSKPGQVLVGTTSVTTGLHHLVMVKSSTAGLIVYTDGVVNTNATLTGAGTTGSAQYIGASTAGTYNWVGVIDEVRLAATPRSASWIAAEFANQSAPGTFTAPSGSPLSTLATTLAAMLLLGF